MYGTVRRGKDLWRKICRGQDRDSFYYVFPEYDKTICCSARKHILRVRSDNNITVICTKESFGNHLKSVRFVILADREMEQLLAYLRTCRDTMLNLKLKNVYVLSFREAGGNSLQKLYEEKIYEEDFLIGRWLLPDSDSPDNGAYHEGKME